MQDTRVAMIVFETDDLGRICEGGNINVQLEVNF